MVHWGQTFTLLCGRAGAFNEPVGDIVVDDEGVARPICALPTDASEEAGTLPENVLAGITAISGGNAAAAISSMETTSPEEGHRLALARQAIGLNMAYLEAMRAGEKPADADATVPQV